MVSCNRFHYWMVCELFFSFVEGPLFFFCLSFTEIGICHVLTNLTNHYKACLTQEKKSILALSYTFIKPQIHYPRLFLFILLNSVPHPGGNVAAVSFQALLLLLECRVERETPVGNWFTGQWEPHVQLPAALKTELLSVGPICWLVGGEPVLMPPRLSVSREKSIWRDAPKRTLFVVSEAGCAN